MSCATSSLLYNIENHFPILAWAQILIFWIPRLSIQSQLWVTTRRSHTNFQPNRTNLSQSPGLQSFGLAVLEADFLRSANQVEIENLLTKVMPGNPKIALDLKYLTKQKSFINKVYEENDTSNI